MTFPHHSPPLKHWLSNLAKSRFNLQHCLILPLNNNSPLLHQLLLCLNPKIHNPQHSISLLTLNRSHMPLPPLRLLLVPHWLRINPHNSRTTLKHPLINIRLSLERKVSRANHTRPVQPDHITRLHIGHQKRQTEVIARRHEVGLCMDVRGDIMRSLRGEVGEELEEGACDFQG